MFKILEILNMCKIWSCHNPMVSKLNFVFNILDTGIVQLKHNSICRQIFLKISFIMVTLISGIRVFIIQEWMYRSNTSLVHCLSELYTQGVLTSEFPISMLKRHQGSLEIGLKYFTKYCRTM